MGTPEEFLPDRLYLPGVFPDQQIEQIRLEQPEHRATAGSYGVGVPGPNETIFRLDVDEDSLLLGEGLDRVGAQGLDLDVAEKGLGLDYLHFELLSSIIQGRPVGGRHRHNQECTSGATVEANTAFSSRVGAHRRRLAVPRHPGLVMWRDLPERVHPRSQPGTLHLGLRVYRIWYTLSLCPDCSRSTRSA
jgi:hypothetical protein